jgi:hypothetical protein
VEDIAARIRSALSTRLTTDHALLFAVPEREGTQLVWTTPAAGTVTRLDRLDPTKRAQALARIETLMGDVRIVARRIAQEPGPARATAEALLAVSRPPPPANVFVVGNTPVIVMWTHEDAPAPPAAPVGQVVRKVTVRGRTPVAAYVSLALGVVCLLAVLGGLARSHAHAQAAADRPIASLKHTLDQLLAMGLSQCRVPGPTK